jgi:2-polyprenyl-3-methyl-5-hydroxy-6-metoxy-1,4-benzoquinol methylase
MERLRTIHKERSDWVLNFLLKNLKGSKSLKILELGAGTGDTLISILSSDAVKVSVFATEPNPSMKPHLQANEIEVLEPLQLESNDFIEKFDAVICFEVLEHLLNPSDTFKLVRSILKKNGYFFASTPNAQSLEVQILREQSTTLDIEHISLLTPASVHALASSNSFKVLEITTPGSLDLELIRRGFADCSVTRDGKMLSSIEMQDFVKEHGFASHMKSVLLKN